MTSTIEKLYGLKETPDRSTSLYSLNQNKLSLKITNKPATKLASLTHATASLKATIKSVSIAGASQMSEKKYFTTVDAEAQRLWNN